MHSKNEHALTLLLLLSLSSMLNLEQVTYILITLK